MQSVVSAFIPVAIFISDLPPNAFTLFISYTRVHCKKVNFTTETQKARSFAEKFRREIRFYPSPSVSIRG